MFRPASTPPPKAETGIFSKRKLGGGVLPDQWEDTPFECDGKPVCRKVKPPGIFTGKMQNNANNISTHSLQTFRR
jgi:hypothetical protein